MSDETELLRIVIAVETLSKHPLARAIVRDGKKKLSDDSSGIQVKSHRPPI